MQQDKKTKTTELAQYDTIYCLHQLS